MPPSEGSLTREESLTDMDNSPLASCPQGDDPTHQLLARHATGTLQPLDKIVLDEFLSSGDPSIAQRLRDVKEQAKALGVLRI